MYCRCTTTFKTSSTVPADVDSIVVAAVDMAVLVPETHQQNITCDVIASAAITIWHDVILLVL